MLALSGARLYIILAVLIGLAGSHAWAYHKGKEQERDKATAAALDFREREQVLIAKISEAEKKREIIYRDKVKIIREEPSECGSCVLSDPALDILRAIGASTKRGPDVRLFQAQATGEHMPGYSDPGS